MGLDMYLERRHYVWQDDRPKLKIEGLKHKNVRAERVSELTEQIGYWRKANAIHRWFIVHCADGDENKTEMYVSHEQLRELLDTVEKVLAESNLVKGKIKNGYTIKNGKEEPIMEDGEYIENPKVAKHLLPTQSGFFFGSTEYDQYYFYDLKETQKILTQVLAEPDDGEIYYVASW